MGPRTFLSPLRTSRKTRTPSLTTSLLQPRDDVYGAYDASHMQMNGPKSATQQPIVTGTSVVAIKFKDGVVIAADNLGTSDPRKKLERINKSRCQAKHTRIYIYPII